MSEKTKVLKTEEVKKKTVVIPMTKEDPDTYVPVCINGKVFQVKKGIEVEVPYEVYELLKNGGYLGIKL